MVNHNVSIKESVHARDGIGIKIKRKNSYRKKSRSDYESYNGPDFYKKDNKYVHKERIIDRENDKYFEKIIDYESGEVLCLKDELLSKHVGYGSNKNKK